jgi:hypothetical protein
LGQFRYFFLFISPETSGTLAVKLSDNGILPPYNQYKRAVTVKTLAIGVFVLPCFQDTINVTKHRIYQSDHLNLEFFPAYSKLIYLLNA